MMFGKIRARALRFFDVLRSQPVDALPTIEDINYYARVSRALRLWRRVGDSAVARQPYRDTLKAVLADNPHLATPLAYRTRVS